MTAEILEQLDIGTEEVNDLAARLVTDERTRPLALVMGVMQQFCDNGTEDNEEVLDAVYAHTGELGRWRLATYIALAEASREQLANLLGAVDEGALDDPEALDPVLEHLEEAGQTLRDIAVALRQPRTREDRQR
ncbi:hypothetical protein ACIBF1_44180 [Spirillospora sp. NPDC050679]